MLNGYGVLKGRPLHGVALAASIIARIPARIAFGHVGLQWEDHVTVDGKFMRPAEVDLLIGDASKAKAALGWAPRTSFEDLVTMMVDADIELLSGRLGGIS